MKLNRPKPTRLSENGNLRIVINNKGQIIVKVYNSHGFMAKKLSTSIKDELPAIELNLSDLEHGQYVLNAFAGDKFIQSIHFIR